MSEGGEHIEPVSCLLSWRPCQVSRLRNRMLNQVLCLFSWLSSIPLLSLFCVHKPAGGKKKTVWIVNDAEGATVEKARLTNLSCRTGVTPREDSVFTNDMICKWSVGGEARRTRWSPGRCVSSNGKQWIKLGCPSSLRICFYLFFSPSSQLWCDSTVLLLFPCVFPSPSLPL